MSLLPSCGNKSCEKALSPTQSLPIVAVGIGQSSFLFLVSYCWGFRFLSSSWVKSKYKLGLTLRREPT